VATPIGPWATSTAPVRASADAIDVWRADLTRVEDGLAELLCAEERERARQIRDVHRRRLWMRSRGVLRALLARYLDGDPRALRFALGPHGKPALRGGPGSSLPPHGKPAPLGGPSSGVDPHDKPTLHGRSAPGDGVDLRFNLSHSGAIALYAVTARHAVGVDVELPRSRQIDEPAIAERVLGARQARRLADLDPQARTREFLRAWVAHEAAAKCRGTGLGTSPTDLAAADLWTAELDVGPDAAAAVAAEGGRYELRCWEWS
jgi:4'-phosphopantetheinyl transferase